MPWHTYVGKRTTSWSSISPSIFVSSKAQTQITGFVHLYILKIRNAYAFSQINVRKWMMQANVMCGTDVICEIIFKERNRIFYNDLLTHICHQKDAGGVSPHSIELKEIPVYLLQKATKQSLEL